MGVWVYQGVGEKPFDTETRGHGDSEMYSYVEDPIVMKNRSYTASPLLRVAAS